MNREPSPPTKASLKAWWSHFTSKNRVPKSASNRPPQLPENRRLGTPQTPGAVFGQPLNESLKYASVQISTADANGQLYVWGYIPVVVAKCGLYLKEQATEVQGTFRVNGSAKRMRELQAVFETPPKFGKHVEWKETPYTTHDVASVFRRYLTQMPEPVIPTNMYFDFRKVLEENISNPDQVITTYKQLIRSMPRPNQYLLLYVLDLLSVFARKSDKNLMTPQNLAVIFRPAIISHPTHELNPTAHHLSQKVVEFLIAQQDWFMLDVGIPPTPGLDISAPLPTGATQPRASTDSEDWKLVSASGPSPSPSPQKEKSISRRRSASPNSLRGLTSKVQRRKTMAVSVAEGSEIASSGELSPVNEDVVLGGSGSAGVSRSRTLPSRSGSKRNREIDQQQQDMAVEGEEIQKEREGSGDTADIENKDISPSKEKKRGLLRKGHKPKRTSLGILGGGSSTNS